MLIDTVLETAVKHRASDIHFAVGLKPFIRVDGQLFELKKESPVTNKIISDFINSVLTKEQLAIMEERKGMDFVYAAADSVRIRVNVHFEKGNLGLVGRIIPATIPTMEDIDCPDILYEFIKQESGLILVTGPAGSGKSTTLAAMIRKINEERSANIITLEDPIEYLHTPKNSIIKQRELGVDMISFEEALRQALREDPNVVMVGEMRDLETISTTVTVAETGHLVLATLHTHNAPQAIDRIIDMFPPSQQGQIKMQLSLSLKCVVSQKLVPREGGGRVAIREVMVNSPAVANLIRLGKVEQIASVIETGSQQGMMSYKFAFREAEKKGWVSKATAKFYTENPFSA
ncbi:PilT/PilU family type 4a pilus ATPase [Patescibacteria group bacterium]|nr:PilT/PilU family type 4a pilus ATPase [Patescibacteria group bacterium]MBU1705214.1 PilT/PilU family type 4a pilus ATPase [Patescibacteria group bacterium]